MGEGEDHEGEEATDDAGTDGGEASEDDSRRKLFQFEALQDAAQNAADNAQEVAMNVGGRINETVQGGLDRVNDFVEGIQGGDANATNATNATTMNDTMNATMNVTDPRLNGTLNATVGNATE